MLDDVTLCDDADFDTIDSMMQTKTSTSASARVKDIGWRARAEFPWYGSDFRCMTGSGPRASQRAVTKER